MTSTVSHTRWGNQSTVAGRLADELSWRIVRGDIPAGELLTEVQVAAEAGVSRTPVREAMLQLQAWGLVRLIPKKGALVQVMSEQSVRDLMAFRGLLESAALDTLVESAALREDLVATLESNVADQRAAVDRGGLLDFSEWDVDFHATLIHAINNSVLDELMGSLYPRMARVIHGAIHGEESQARKYLREHAELVDCLKAGNADEAHAVLNNHILMSTLGARTVQ